MPIAEWLRGPLRDWAEDLISVNRLKADGIFHHEPVRQAWEQHLSGERSWAYHLWDVLMFQAWLRSGSSAIAGPMDATRARESTA
jgi:asparagine synthase (glutamine-hydrolysing)